MSNQAKGYEVCDPDGNTDEWTRIDDALSATDAARMFLSVLNYDERELDTGFPFELHVRVVGDDDFETVEVCVVPAHFEVS